MYIICTYVHVHMYCICSIVHLVQTYLLEKVRVAQRPVGEGVFNIFPNLLVGADAKLKSDLQLDIPVSDSTNAYISMEQFGDVSLTICSVCVPVCVRTYVCAYVRMCSHFSLMLTYVFMYIHICTYGSLCTYVCT